MELLFCYLTLDFLYVAVTLESALNQIIINSFSKFLLSSKNSTKVSLLLKDTQKQKQLHNSINRQSTTENQSS